MYLNAERSNGLYKMTPSQAQRVSELEAVFKFRFALHGVREKIMGAGLLLVSWILRASLVSVILEESKFSLAAVPGSEDLNVNVTKMAVHRPSILAWVRKSINRRRFEKARTKLRVALGRETQTFFCARFANTLAIRARSRALGETQLVAERNRTSSDKLQFSHPFWRLGLTIWELVYYKARIEWKAC